MLTVSSGDGTAIAYELRGDGPATILVGGALSNRESAAGLATILSARFSVLAYDRRGRGDSGDTPPYAVEREIDDLATLIDLLGAPARVYGHSSGAALALRAAAEGLRIERLALYEPPFIVDDSRPPLPKDFGSKLTALSLSDRRGDAVEYFLLTGIGLSPEVVSRWRESPRWPDMEAIAHTLAYDAAIMEETTAGRPLPSAWTSLVTVPTLVMDGGNSQRWQRRAMEELVAVLPNAERRTFEDADHGIAADELAPVLETFFGPSTP